MSYLDIIHPKALLPTAKQRTFSGMDSITVRRAGPRDLDDLLPLFEGYRDFYRCQPDKNAARTFLSERLSRGDSTIFIAIDKKARVAAGFVQLYPVFSSLQMRPALILNDLFVSPAYRGHKVSRQLMDAARQHALETGAVSIALETAPDNHKARKLYESLGYKLEQSFMQYVLDLRT